MDYQKPSSSGTVLSLSSGTGSSEATQKSWLKYLAVLQPPWCLYSDYIYCCELETMTISCHCLGPPYFCHFQLALFIKSLLTVGYSGEYLFVNIIFICLIQSLPSLAAVSLRLTGTWFSHVGGVKSWSTTDERRENQKVIWNWIFIFF